MAKRKTISNTNDVPAIKALASAAVAINRELATVGKLEGQADDARLKAAVMLAAAKKSCADIKQPFQRWCEKHIKQSWETVRKLVTIGESDNPAAALAEMRQRNAERNKAHRDKRAHAGKGAAKADKAQLAPPDPVGDLQKALDKIGDLGAVSVCKTWFAKRGFALIEQKTVTALHTRIEYLEKRLPKHDAAVAPSVEPAGDVGDIPEFLDRRATRKTAAKRKPAKRARKAA